ncbi:VCBS repeat-containing protein [Streptomyces sp. SCA3-4]|uniref:FG-GAP repeat domain-containing protein n=1 Tax=Streptomyces sichuanensis TaxID=2871810 RepID=UPI001CE383D1|nr:VCBS repeat-containing protein [Streptomyces sichuanensis]MCA6094001.1 VCBS repeat-containing protein [Streptomyces sichuanensis]
MGNLPGRKRGRALSRLATAAIAAALLGTTAGTAVADGTTPATPSTQKAAGAGVLTQAAPRTAVAQRTAAAPVFPLTTVDRSGTVYMYAPDGKGALGDRSNPVVTGWQVMAGATRVDHNQDGYPDGLYSQSKTGTLYFNKGVDEQTVTIGGGWDIYDRILSPGNLGGAQESDLLARDKSGVLWIYLAHPDGTLSDRYRVGPGWDIYTDIAGRGDLNGDGKADMVAKDKSGALWFYKGTGDYKDPFESRVKVGPGWDIYDTLLSIGDMDKDGRSDMLARDRSGVLWFYKGNGNQNDPFENRVRIGGGWDQYVSMF